MTSKSNQDVDCGSMCLSSSTVVWYTRSISPKTYYLVNKLIQYDKNLYNHAGFIECCISTSFFQSWHFLFARPCSRIISGLVIWTRLDVVLPCCRMKPNTFSLVVDMQSSDQWSGVHWSNRASSPKSTRFFSYWWIHGIAHDTNPHCVS